GSGFRACGILTGAEDLDVLPRRIAFGETEQPRAFGLQFTHRWPGQRTERLDDQDRALFHPLYLPGACDEAVDEERRADLKILEHDPRPVLVGPDARAIGMRQHQVVELGEKTRRRRRIAVRPRRIRKIEELAVR